MATLTQYTDQARSQLWGRGGAIATPEEVIAPPGEISANLGKFRDFSIETHRPYTLFPRPGLIEITGDCL